VDAKTMDSSTAAIELRITIMMPHLNEKQRRLFLATEAKALGHGGITQISTLSGVSRVTITKGTKEINQPEKIQTTRCRKKGGGRKTTKQTHPNITEKIQNIIEPHTKGKPTTPLLWTSKSTRNIAKELAKNENINISHVTVADLLAQNGYSLQANRKDIAIQPKHPDRNAQFEYINKQAQLFLDKNAPVLSIDAKKKELLGNFKNNGKTYRKKGEPSKVLDHDFPLKELGKAVPYGVYDVFKNTGFVNVGVSGDTAEFAVESLRKWWVRSGQLVYGSCGELLVTCDCGGSNGYRVRLWKVQLQLLANELGVKITVLHYPPGTSKWNKIEHHVKRMKN